jgi:hypothetical protein
MNNDEINKYTITADVTVGSHFPEKRYESDIMFPEGGEMRIIKVEFESTYNNFMYALRDAIQQQLGRGDWHLWYWY